MPTLAAHDYRTGAPIRIETANGRITAIHAGSPQAGDHVAQWVSPAWFDLQINGALGISFNAHDLTIEQVHRVIHHCRSHGIGALLPTLVTTSEAAFAHGYRILTQAMDQDTELAQRIAGFHQEGPFLSSEDGPRGAHPRDQVRPPDWDEFCRLQDAARGRIRLLTLAPEQPGAIPLIERVVASGVVVAIGHTAATPAQIRDAVAAGATLSTHLGNGSHAMLPRHDNYLWEQLGTDALHASIIPDGFHLPETLVRIFTRVKTPQRLIITCDASSLAGLPAGRYSMWGNEFEIAETGRIGVPGTPFLAGSGVFTDQCIGTMLRMTGISLAEAISMASDQPRRLLGLPIPELAVGHPADLVGFNWEPGGPLSVTVPPGRISA
ncbi:N-acetylglucosamine-6-phosphate deacetylase [Tuwongella immobilis]|uniref:N-acetylglucosamine-6-phosphate deacetylase: N-acetylglucosamine-6-phosphate deacetylase n=1 Tax=Tuwongella immobilis TaxID=692036 RepID=A0A6C2YI69_9BACT|nr:N-acetylglucosamine-6-phosphate deacetylase [Tuwongella immobilis]VIP01106.1 n-acetylglucosamine-6-phosphate deacetylase : N-acetylglucosamine-6-phosphate deacetylase OS=Planctomyces maris DSM 8797 GN=PM8797T_21563 PE=3 SV=1 [Tuwongella immobilis]VTR97637.1 n-acetylglucosamine-6-phosphate deacetylase : N-acetylglucosamine-6-phosphate deacetylase OS=Planctomyces maris DSM 8797 GN=PM8797T_21563 PE=3 SV=1 [Tuwongella immobilis]